MTLLVLSACQDRIDPFEGQPDITFGVGELETKALLNANDLQTAGTVLTVYDFLTGFDGTLDGVDHELADIFSFFGPQDLTRGTSAWTIGSDYRWTKGGTHSFFGWLKQDASGLKASDLFGTGNPVLQCSNNNATRILSIPAKVMTASTPQFDFAYSGIEARKAGDTDYTSTVTFNMKHLFTAMSLTLENASKDVIYLQSAELIGLYNEKSATIDYSPATDTAEPAVTLTNVHYSDQQTGGTPVIGWTGVRTLEKTGSLPKIDLWTGNAPTMDGSVEIPNFLLMWPQSISDLRPDTDTGKPGAAIRLVYTIKDYVDVDDNPIVQTATVPLYTLSMLQNSGMQAGHRYKLSLQFEGETFKLNLSVLPWEYVEKKVSYAEAAISAYNSGSNNEGKLCFYLDGTTAGENYSMNLGSQHYAVGEFYINSPKSGEWNVEIYPASAAQYFSLSLPENRTLTPSMFESEYVKVNFTVRESELTPTATQTIHFNVLIRINNEWHDANSEFNRKDWKISRQPNT